MSNKNVENQAPQLCDAWYVIVNELWPLLLATHVEADRTAVLFRISELKNKLRPVIEGLAAAAEERGIDSTPLLDLLLSLHHVSDEVWDAANALVRRLQVVQEIIPRPANANAPSRDPDLITFAVAMHRFDVRDRKTLYRLDPPAKVKDKNGHCWWRKSVLAGLYPTRHP